MAVSTATLQTGNPAAGTVSRRPQTTAIPQGGGQMPFARMSRKGNIQGPSQAGQAFGSLWTPQLKPVGGYLRFLKFVVTATGGNLTAATASADAPWNTVQNFLFKDPYAQPIFTVAGYDLYLINLYSGQTGMLGYGNAPTAAPSFSPVNTTTGVFSYSLFVPFEGDSSGYGSLPDQNASSQPTLTVQLNPQTSVYSATTGTTAPTLQLTVDEYYWMSPIDNPTAAPPDPGSSLQWSKTRAASSVASSLSQRIQLQPVGTYTSSIILVMRDSTGARIDAWPTADLTLWIDGIPVLTESFLERQDEMFRQFGVTRPTGVICYTYRDAVQFAVSNADNWDCLLPTTPATLLEVGGTWGTITNAPAIIEILSGQLYPLGGIPYTHLAQ